MLLLTCQSKFVIGTVTRYAGVTNAFGAWLTCVQGYRTNGAQWLLWVCVAVLVFFLQCLNLN